MFSSFSKIDQHTINQMNNFLQFLLFDNDLVIDSRLVNDKSIFCAYPGINNDRREYIDQAIKQGAKCILWETGIDFNYQIPNFSVKNLGFYVGLLAVNKYGNPSRNFKTIGVTGTNGKTSITHWLSQAYYLLDKKVGIIGTTGAGIYPNTLYNNSTTPDPLTLHQLLADFAKQNIDRLSMEVSSHSLHQGRVNGVNFTTAIFTNLTHDHLDYHGTMDNYYIAKRDLFFWQNLENAVINSDDNYGSRLLNDLNKRASTIKIIDYGLTSGNLQAHNIIINLI